MEQKQLQMRGGMIGVALLLMAMMSYLLQQGTVFLQSLDKHFGWGWPPLVWQGISLLVGIVYIAVPTVFLISALGESPQRLIPLVAVRADYLWPAMGVAFGVAVAGNYFSVFLLALLQQAGYTAITYMPEIGSGVPSMIFTVLAAGVVPAILEEFLFRGAILQALRPFGNGFAVVVSAVLFAVCHASFAQLIPALLIGLCLGCFTIRSGSLVPGMIFHFLYNTLALVLFILQESGNYTVMTVIWFYAFGSASALTGAFFLRRRFGPVFALPNDPQPSVTINRFAALLKSIPLIAGLAYFLYFTIGSIIPIAA